MNVALTDDLQRLLRKKVEDGQFPNEEAVVQQALRSFLVEDPAEGSPQKSCATESQKERLPGPFIEDDADRGAFELPRDGQAVTSSTLLKPMRMPDLFPGTTKRATHVSRVPESGWPLPLLVLMQRETVSRRRLEAPYRSTELEIVHHRSGLRIASMRDWLARKLVFVSRSTTTPTSMRPRSPASARIPRSPVTFTPMRSASRLAFRSSMRHKAESSEARQIAAPRPDRGRGSCQSIRDCEPRASLEGPKSRR